MLLTHQPQAWVGLFLIAVLLVFFGGYLTAMVTWTRTWRYAKNGESVGGPPWVVTPLEPDEQILGETQVIYRATRFVGYEGMLYLTDRRMIYVPRRVALDVIKVYVHSIRRADVTAWRVEKRRLWAVGWPLMRRRVAIVVESTEGMQDMYWPSPSSNVELARGWLESATSDVHELYSRHEVATAGTYGTPGAATGRRLNGHSSCRDALQGKCPSRAGRGQSRRRDQPR